MRRLQAGNYSQREWSEFVSEIRNEISAHGLEVYFFGASEGSQPWQNACWVVSVAENVIDGLLFHITKVRKKYRQESVAVVTGSVRMI